MDDSDGRGRPNPVEGLETRTLSSKGNPTPPHLPNTHWTLFLSNRDCERFPLLNADPSQSNFGVVSPSPQDYQLLAASATPVLVGLKDGGKDWPTGTRPVTTSPTFSFLRPGRGSLRVRDEAPVYRVPDPTGILLPLPLSPDGRRGRTRGTSDLFPVAPSEACHSEPLR